MQNPPGRTFLTEIEENVLITMLELDEGMVLYPYDDATGLRVQAPKGHITIGIGINLDLNLTRDEAIYLCRGRIKALQIQLMTLPFYQALDTVRKLVLLNVAFNVGANGLMKFKNMLTAVSRNDWKKATAELSDSNAARKLGARYSRLADTLEDGFIAPAYLLKMKMIQDQFKNFPLPPRN